MLAEIVARTKRAEPLGTVRVTAFALVGSNVYAAAATSVENADPSVLPLIATVWLRAPHDGGSLSTTRPSAVAVPRSTCIHCGNALLALSQYDPASPSTALPDAYVWLWLDSDVGRCKARFVVEEAGSVVTDTAFEAPETLPAASDAVTTNVYAVAGVRLLTVKAVVPVEPTVVLVDPTT